MAEYDLCRLERMGTLRRHADEARLRRTRQALDEAVALRLKAERRSAAQAALEQASIRGCYGDPASEQARIARQHHGQLADRARDELRSRRAEETALCGRKAADARTLLRDDARLNMVQTRLERARRAHCRREEDESAQERMDGARHGVAR